MHKYIFTIPALLISILILVTACEKDEVETIPLQTVNGEILETVDYGTKVFLFKFNTDLETYPITYLIRNETSVEGNQVNINLIDIQKDGHDDLNIQKGPASCLIQLGALSNGVYDLQIKAGTFKGTGTFTIEDGRVTIDFPSTEGITITHDTLNRIPFGTIWGYVGYQSTSNAGIANAFISNMDALGAENAEFAPGYYGYFSVSDSGDIIQPIDEQFEYYKEYFKTFDGAGEAMDEHVSYFIAEYYNKIDIFFYWYYDGDLKRFPQINQVSD
jgi:hypothetical protein